MALLSHETVKTDKLICIFLPHSCQGIACCQNAAGTSGEQGAFTYSDIVFLGFVKTHFYIMCILD